MNVSFKKDKCIINFDVDYLFCCANCAPFDILNGSSIVPDPPSYDEAIEPSQTSTETVDFALIT